MSTPSTRASFWAMMCHLSTLLGFFLPGVSLVAPLIIWGTKGDQDLLIKENGRNVINFVLSFWLYSLGLVFIIGFFAIILFIPVTVITNLVNSNSFPPALFLGVGVFFLGYILVYAIFHLVLPIYGGIKALNGDVYRYPLTIPFLKQTRASLTPHISSTK